MKHGRNPSQVSLKLGAFAQARGVLSLKLLRRDCNSIPESFASSRLGEAASPERDSLSLKNTAPRLGERSSRKLGEFLLISPSETGSLGREDQNPPVFAQAQSGIRIKQGLNSFPLHYNSNQAFPNNEQNQNPRKSNKTTSPSFPYLELARKRVQLQQRDITIPGIDERARKEKWNES